MQLLTMFLHYALRAYVLLIFVYVLGSWFPQWRQQAWYRLISDLVQPYLQLFSKLPLRVGMLDLTPMLALLILMVVDQFVQAMYSGA
ncbi:YggT family protein [bacterium]|nr:YggT family protein [bacterium]